MTTKARELYHVMRSTECGEMLVDPYLRRDLAEKLANVLNEIAKDRDSDDDYYVKKYIRGKK